MVAFRTPVDIGNRGLQHCGATRIDPVLGFTENSKNASEVAFCYDKLREAELRRNVWTHACRRAMLRAVDSTTMLLVAALWAQGTTYFVGSIVSDQNDGLWISKVPDNLGNDPLASTTWEPYFGPLTATPYDSAISYFAGELVYTTAGDGTNRVYLSLQSDNTDDPATPTAWDATASYSKDDVVTYLATAYLSLIDLNTGQFPNTVPAAWDIATSYNLSDTVTGSDNVIYSSLGTGNTGYDPTTDGGAHWLAIGAAPWTSSFIAGRGSLKWRQIGGAEFPMGASLAKLNITYPLGTSPRSQAGRSIYHLPAGFLRIASQNPGSGTVSWLGGPSGMTYRDWAFENGFLLTGDTGPIPLRFVANLTDVSRMDPMFCEGLAARVGMEVCEPVTQSTAKLGTIAKIYDEWMSQARTQNAIEQGPDEPPEDDWITVRL